ncbi:threonine dehydratase [Labrys sp. La1]|uniref:threonine dehydratase n=1 Tax=Labrys sp. La1 TaxID=3404917 RepID=UPI003EBF56F1
MMITSNVEIGPNVDAYRFGFNALAEARDIVRRVVQPTPQIEWPLLAQRTGAQVWVKHENHLPTGAFKMRGGLVLAHALLAGRHGPVPSGVITATVGNHGLSQAFAGRRAGLQVTIVVPENNNPEKNAAIKALGAELIEAGHDFSAAYEIAQGLARERRLHLIEPFHPDLVRGVATWAYEFFEAVQEVDTVYVPIGLGSGICGLIRTRDLFGLKTRIVGVVSSHAAAYALSFEAGKVVSTQTAQTIADGVAVRVPRADALEIIRRGADRIVTVSDDEVRLAMRAYHEDTHNLAEGAAATPLAALLQERARMGGQRVGLVMTGANISRPLLAQVLSAT